MHVVMIAPPVLPIPPTHGGSVQIYDAALCAALCQMTHEHDASMRTLTLVSPGQPPTLSRAGLSHIQISPDSEHYSDELAVLLPRLKPDLIQIENRPGYVSMAATRCPDATIILNLHSTTFLQPQRIAYEDARNALQQAAKVVCNSHFLRRSIEVDFDLTDKVWRPQVIYPGVDFAQFQASRQRVKPHRPLRMLFVGRIIREKGLHVAIDTLRLLRQQKVNVHLTVIGQAPTWQRKYLLSLKRGSSRLPITWKGFIQPDELGRQMRHQDLLICPSQTREAFGLVNVEALASGLPVVASNVGGIPEVVDPTCGVLVRQADDPVRFAAAVKQLTTPKTWRMYHEGAIKHAARFTWERTAQQFLALYETLRSGLD